MKKIFLIAVIAGISNWHIQAQTIFSYGNKSVDKKEFQRLYDSKNKNTPGYNTKASLDEYVNLYALFKMKVAEAESLHLDTTTAFRTDLNQYKAQLAKSYMLDESVNEKLLREAYDRSLYDVEIAHIQVSARGTDTSEAYKKITDIYNELNSGKITFEEAAAKYSEDMASRSSNGNVGYISALDVLYPIETAAYTTEAGKYAPPVRSDYGYHIVKVLNKRPSRGQVQVAQILVTANTKDEASIDVAKHKAENYYRKLKDGADFTQMVKEFSEDKFSVNNNGILPAFSSGKLDPAFEKAAFTLEKPGDISEPVQTEYGFHILKLVKKIPVPSFDESKEDLMARLKKDGRVSLAEKAMKEKLLNGLGYQEYTDNLDQLVELINKDTSKKVVVTVEKFANYNQPLFSIQNQKYTQKDFVAFMVDATGGQIYGRKDKTVRDLYRMYHNKVIEDLQIQNLEKNNEEFKNSVDEYRESFLLFSMMESKVWNRAINDAAGLNQYYEANKQKYLLKAGLSGNIFESASRATLTLLKNQLAAGADQIDALQAVNEEARDKATMQSGKYEYEQLPAPVSGLIVNQPSEVYQASNGNFFLIVPDALFGDNTQKTFEEARGLVVSDYQAYLEEEWTKELSAKYPLKINEKELKKMVRK